MIESTGVRVAAGRLRRVMDVSAIVLVAVALVGIVAIGRDPAGFGTGLAEVGGHVGPPLAAWQGWALAAVLAGHVALWLGLLAVARGMFACLAAGEPAPAAERARTLSLLLWAVLGWSLLSQPVASVVATWGFPEGERALALSIGTSQISLAFCALIAGFLARAFALGAELWQDHRAVI